MLVREDTRRKCGQTVAVESECERGEEGVIMEWKGNGAKLGKRDQ